MGWVKRSTKLKWRVRTGVATALILGHTCRIVYRSSSTVEQLVAWGRYTIHDLDIGVPPSWRTDQRFACVFPVRIGSNVTVTEAQSCLPNLVDPVTALYVGMMYPNLQKEASLVTFWQTDKGEWRTLILTHDKQGNRRIRTKVVEPNFLFNRQCRFLVKF